MRDNLQLIAMIGIMVAMLLTVRRGRRIGGIAVVAFSFLYLATAVVLGSYSNLRYDVMLSLIFASVGLDRLGIINLDVPTSQMPYRIDGIIKLIAAVAAVALAILMPQVRFFFIVLFLLLLRLGLSRVGIQPLRV
jgi:hypothetical protein